MNYRHGKSKTRTYHVWSSMKARCSNPANDAYARYGGRGITVCERWFAYENFHADMGDCPKGLTIERIDNNKGYGPDNCIWADRRTQGRNKRGLHNLTIDGETHPLIVWVEKFSVVSYVTAHQRLAYGWDALEAVSRPLTRRKKGDPSGPTRLFGYDASTVIQTAVGEMTLAEAVRESCLSVGTISTRIRRGWPLSMALSLAPRRGPRKEAFGAERGVEFRENG